MQTSELVSLVKYQANKWGRTGLPGILPILNQAQNILLQVESEANVKIDPATGEFPMLTTVAGTYEYNCPTDCWRTAEILVAYELYEQYGSTLLNDYGNSINISRPIQDVEYNGKHYVRYQQVRSKDADNAGVATVTFMAFDPGTTDDIYYHRYYKRPTQITSERIQHSMPSPADFMYLLPATQALVNGMEKGTFQEALRYVTRELKPAYWKEQNKGAQSQNYFVRRNPI